MEQGSITLSLPQNISSASSPTFNGADNVYVTQEDVNKRLAHRYKQGDFVHGRIDDEDDSDDTDWEYFDTHRWVHFSGEITFIRNGYIQIKLFKPIKLLSNYSVRKHAPREPDGTDKSNHWLLVDKNLFEISIQDSDITNHLPQRMAKSLTMMDFNLALHEMLNFHMKDLVFRRVSSVRSLEQSFRYGKVCVIRPDGKGITELVCGKVELDNEIKRLDKDNACYKVLWNHDGFTATTTRDFMRSNDKYNGKEINLHGSKCGKFQLDCRFKNPVLIYGRHNSNNFYDPCVGDIVCGIVVKNSDDDTLWYKKWFLCSPEFLYFWTFIRFGPDKRFSLRQILNKMNPKNPPNNAKQVKVTPASMMNCLDELNVRDIERRCEMYEQIAEYSMGMSKQFEKNDSFSDILWMKQREKKKR